MSGTELIYTNSRAGEVSETLVRMADLSKFELLSLVSKITQEINNHVGKLG